MINEEFDREGYKPTRVSCGLTFSRMDELRWEQQVGEPVGPGHEYRPAPRSLRQEYRNLTRLINSVSTRNVLD